ncbi:PREDICTED: uncharacterized protein LOC109351630 isoform X3 [Lupinus angustifolius]|uniref:uncharacterized protein LOC109351630 isoform X3 n=1 Tax=Lupinus angustifolius TaxID=3871 RepID=UPI00092E8E8F|nr:PREDICTED: uncharacterized protein LOC109351630 isoform X3 [Lupinus angustifolius]
MSAPQRLLCTIYPSFSHSSFYSRNFLLLPFSHFSHFSHSLTLSRSSMPRNQQRSGQRWKEKPKADDNLSATRDAESAAATATENVRNRLAVLHTADNSGTKARWKPKSYGTSSGAATPAETENKSATKVTGDNLPVHADVASTKKSSNTGLSKLFQSELLENFTVDNSTYSRAQIRATFYPKFENEKSDQETRTRMIEVVSKGLATLEVSLKHSGSLFMYSGHEGGAYAKNSFGNIYTAVGVFVLGRMFREAWGIEASKKQAEFNDFLEKNHMCISMELVTAVLGDHGQRPREDYAVVTAVTELGNGKPIFYSTPEIIAFCRKWRLPTNHVWLFSTRKSASSFFAAYDALCEEGTATSVCKTLDEIANISVLGSLDHIKAQGEILEGLVARLVSHESSNHMEKVLKEFPIPPADGAALDLGPSLRDICAANRSDEKQIGLGAMVLTFIQEMRIDLLFRSFYKPILQTIQLKSCSFELILNQEIVRLMREKRFPAAFKCYHNFHKVDAISSDNLFCKMVIHVHSDSTFRRYQKEMRHRPGLWPLYRGFFVDINLFKANKERSTEISKSNGISESGGNSSEKDELADEDANLMVKLKFLTYKLRTFLIRNGLSVLFKEGPGAYKAYYLRQMKIWGTSPGKQRELSKMLDEWAVYIRRKCGNKQLSSSIYLSEAEPFLEQFAKRSPQNQTLIGSAGNLVRTEDFLAIVNGGEDEEGDLATEREIAPPGPSVSVKDTVPKNEGLIVFFPGIPGCAKSALCKELLKAEGGLGDDRPVHSLMGDLVKGRYWQKVAEERRKKPNSIMLADKNAPNEEVWRQIEDMCHRTKAYAVPVVPESEGTDSNPFALDALAVFIFRVLQRVNHPGNLDKASPNAGYVLLMFYHLYENKSRKDFEGELIERFGSLIKMPLLKSDRSPLPEAVQSILEEGVDLYMLHTKRHGRLESTKGSYAKEWIKWEKQLRDILCGNAEYFNSIQVPFEFAVKHVLEQLRSISKGDYSPPDTEKRKLGTIVFAAVSLPVPEILDVLNNLAEKNPKIGAFLKDKHLEKLSRAHLTLAHKRSHGIKAVADYGLFLHKTVPVELTALLFSDKTAAFEAFPGSVDGEKIISKNAWPHITVWTSEGVAAKEANMLQQLFSEGKAHRIDFNPPISVSGTIEFF